MPALHNSASAPPSSQHAYYEVKHFFQVAVLAVFVLAVLVVRHLWVRSRAAMSSNSFSSSSSKQPAAGASSDEKSEKLDLSVQTDFPASQPQRRPYAPPEPWSKYRAAWSPPPPRPTLQLKRDLIQIAQEVQFSTPSQPQDQLIPRSISPSASYGFGAQEGYPSEEAFDEKSFTVVGAGGSQGENPLELPIRRRSYTRTVEGELSPVQVQGELMASPVEGWTRHTRVYGGGVCLACLESEEKMRS